MEIPPSDDQVSKKPNLQANLWTYYRSRDDGEVSVSYENFESWSEGTIAIFEMVEQALITPLPKILEYTKGFVCLVT